jgi:hypothetical protein
MGQILGALVITFLISRGGLWLTRQWAGYAQIVGVHVLCAVFAVVASAFGHADGGPLDWSYSWGYLGAQAIWLVVDLFAHRGRADSLPSGRGPEGGS